MSVKLGVSLIAWQNDDLPDLTAAYTTDGAMQDAARIGYSGVERGRRMPADTDGLRAYLDKYGVALCGGWCSGNLMTATLDAEKAAVRAQVEQFAALNAPCLVYAECSNTVQGQIGTPLSRRPKLSRDDITAYGAKLSELAKWMAGQGVVLAYHHHMGSMIQDAEDIDWLMEASDPEVTLLFDTGHLVFAGADPWDVFERWGHRVSHVHVKDVRADVARRMHAEDRSFLEAVTAGVFTVPGDGTGSIDFNSLFGYLRAMNYSGWIVVEAEQDPARADPATYAQLGYHTLRDLCDGARLAVTR
jgi:inosose dehydratase